MDEAFGNTECNLVMITVSPVFYESLPLLKSSIGFSCYFISKFFCSFEDVVEGGKKKNKTALVFVVLSVFAWQSNPQLYKNHVPFKETTPTVKCMTWELRRYLCLLKLPANYST